MMTKLISVNSNSNNTTLSAFDASVMNNITNVSNYTATTMNGTETILINHNGTTATTTKKKPDYISIDYTTE